MSNIDRHPECHMRTALGNCDPLGGFCTSVNEPICEALHKVSRPHGEWVIDGHHIRCKQCGVYFCIEDREGNAYPQNFCPNCGVYMRRIDDEKECHKPESEYYRAYCEERKEETYCEGCKFWY